jgi:parallel beta-helix repeat protein
MTKPRSVAATANDNSIPGSRLANGTVSFNKLDQSSGTLPSSAIQYSSSSVGSVPRTVSQRLEDLRSVKDFGAVGDGVTDDSAAFQAAVDAIQGTGLALYVPDGEYLLSRQGSYALQFAGLTRHYAVRISQPLRIFVDGTIRFPVNDPSNNCTAFVFDQTQDCGIYGGKYEGTDITAGFNTTLYDGLCAILNACDHSVISGLYGENTSGVAQCFTSRSCVIDSCFYNRTQTSPSLLVGSAFTVYGSEYCILQNCSTYGGTFDGDLGLYGTGRFNKILNCRAHSFRLDDSTKTPVNTGLQGIVVDAGQNDSTVESCYCQGYFYGIDVKSNISNCLVTGNTVYANKVGITARRGELNASSMGVQITNNMIIPRTGNGNTFNLLGYIVHGIFIQDFAQTTISGNRFCVSYADSGSYGNQNWIGIRYHEQTTFNTAQEGTPTIENNHFIYTQNQGGNGVTNSGEFVRATGRGSMMMNITGNTFKPRSGNPMTSNIRVEGAAGLVFNNNIQNWEGSSQNTATPFLEVSDVHSVQVCNNYFRNPATVLDIEFKTAGQSKTSQLIFSNNTFEAGISSARPLVTADGTGGIVMMGNCRFRPNVSSNFTDNKLLVWTNAQATPCLTLVGNTFTQTNYTSSNYYTVNGADAATGPRIKVFDNVN